MKIICQIALLGLPVLFVVSCSKKNESTSSAGDVAQIRKIKPAFEDLAVRPSEVSVQQVEKGGSVKLNDQTDLEFPAAAFVYEDGSPVRGKVDFVYKEYRDAADIILSGIPMEYDSAGTEFQFQTAGMFDIAGFQENRPVFVAEGKTLTIKMKSDVTEPDYNFYKFDTTTGNWNYLSNCTLDSASLTSDVPAVDPDYPVGPSAYDPNGHIIDLKIDASDFPELKSLKGLMWQYAGTDVQKDLIAKTWIYNEKWKNIEIVPVNRKESVFRLSLANSKTSFSTLVKPVLAGKAFDKAMAEFRERKENYDREKEAAAGQSLRKNQLVTRVLGIQRFGLYNCDRIYNAESALFVDASVKTSNDQFNTSKDGLVYLVTGGSRTAFRLTKDKLKKMRFVPQDDNALVVILPEKKVAVFSSEKFKSININKIRSEGRYEFTPETMPEEIATADDLRKLIGN